MTRSPRTVAPDALVAEALELISRKISALLVVEAGEVVGIIHFHDLLGSARPRGGAEAVVRRAQSGASGRAPRRGKPPRAATAARIALPWPPRYGKSRPVVAAQGRARAAVAQW